MSQTPPVERLPNPELGQALRACAADAGFSAFGIAPAVTPAGFHRLLEWLAAGHAGEMAWIERRREAYAAPSGVLRGAKSVIVAALNYFDGTEVGPGGRVSRYARGPADYHDQTRLRLRRLADAIHAARPEATTRVVVDTAPLLERDFGRLAGLGWFGKNTMLISRTIGSWFFLGAVLTDIELDYDEPGTATWCGTCTRCLDACPTDAFPEPGVLDARRCISYLTIELRNAPIPRELREGIGDWVFGCDVCQEVCPWNRFAPQDAAPEFQSRPDLNPVDCRGLLRMTSDEFASRFAHTPLSRPGRNGLRRNAAIVLGNLRQADAETELATALADPDPVLRGAAAWALGRLRTATAVETLRGRQRSEPDPQVLDEIHEALLACSRPD